MNDDGDGSSAADSGKSVSGDKKNARYTV